MPTDPRRPGGDIGGPGGPHDRHGVVLDTRDAVLLDQTDVAMIEPDPGSGRLPAVALLLSGKINKADERASILFLMSPDGAASVVSELTQLFARAGYDPAIQADFLVALEEKMNEIPGRSDGNGAD